MPANQNCAGDTNQERRENCDAAKPGQGRAMQMTRRRRNGNPTANGRLVAYVTSKDKREEHGTCKNRQVEKRQFIPPLAPNLENSALSNGVNSFSTIRLAGARHYSLSRYRGP
jgi:hypothetical protein